MNDIVSQVLLPSKIYERVLAFRDVQERLGNFMTTEQAMAKLIEEALMTLWPECRPLSKTEKRSIETQERNSDFASRGWEGSTRRSKHVREEI
jgi:hypothetical protein